MRFNIQLTPDNTSYIIVSIKNEMGKMQSLAGCIIFIFFSIPIIIQDIKHQRIPDIYTFVGIAVLLIICGFGAVLSLKDTFIGIMAGFSFFFLVRVVTKGKLGLGDVKYAAFLGGILGLRLWLASVLIASLCGLGVCFLLILMKKMNRRDRIPFAPFMAAGAGAVLFYPAFEGLLL